MKAKKTPAPQRAGTHDNKRAAEMLRVVERLEWLAVHKPQRHRELMQLLARLERRARSRKK